MQICVVSGGVFDTPAINPNYLSHLANVTLIREGLKLARQIGQTAPLSNSIGKDILPGTQVNTDDDWNNYLARAIPTEYHPSCTCAMLPPSQGGFVDANLLAFGLSESLFEF